MIRVQRTGEPQALIHARTTRLPDAVAAYEAHGAPSRVLSELLTGYNTRAIKLTLFVDQHKKCAWCERQRDFSSSAVEHVRPKDSAWRHLPGEPRQVDAGHYWWLTWTWTNLVFACPRCNDRGHKANYFPLAANTSSIPTPLRPLPSPLPPALFDVSAEHPLLLDPAADVFLDHVRWVPSNTGQARNLWIWSPHPLTERGRATIRILKLDELADELQLHLVDHVLQGVTDVEQHMRGGRTRQAQDRWRAVLRLLEPDRSFTAATWCALTVWMDDARRTTWNLDPLPRPR